MTIQMKNDGSAVGIGTSAPAGSGSMSVVSGTADDNLSAVVLALLDEINNIRTLGLLGLAAKTPAQIATAIAAKKA